MFKIPHYSRLEKMKNNLKRQAERKDKERGAMTEDDYKEKIAPEKTLIEKLRLLRWDWDRMQLSETKYQYFSELIDERLKEEISADERRELENIQKRIKR